MRRDTPVDIRPLSDNIVVELVNDATTSSGIVLPDIAKDKLQRGRVKAVGSGRLLDNGTRAPLEVKPEDVVLFHGDSGTKVKVDGTEYLLLRESDILAVLSPAPALV